MLLQKPIILRLLGLYTDIKQTHVRIDGCIMGCFFISLTTLDFVAIGTVGCSQGVWYRSLYLGLYVYN